MQCKLILCILHCIELFHNFWLICIFQEVPEDKTFKRDTKMWNISRRRVSHSVSIIECMARVRTNASCKSKVWWMCCGEVSWYQSLYERHMCRYTVANLRLGKKKKETKGHLPSSLLLLLFFLLSPCLSKQSKYNAFSTSRAVTSTLVLRESSPITMQRKGKKMWKE